MSRGLKKVSEGVRRWGRVVQSEKAASAKVLRWECVWYSQT